MLILTRRAKECILLQFPTGSETLEVMSRDKVRIGKDIFRVQPGEHIERNGLDILCKSWRGGQMKLGFTGPLDIHIIRSELL